MNDTLINKLDGWAAEKRKAEVAFTRGGYTLAVVRGTLRPRSIPALFSAWLVMGGGSSGANRAVVMPQDRVSASCAGDHARVYIRVDLTQEPAGGAA